VKRKRKVFDPSLGQPFTPGWPVEPGTPSLPSDKTAGKTEEQENKPQPESGACSEPLRIVDLKKRLPFSDVPRQAFHNKLQLLTTEKLGMPDPANYPPPGRPTLRIAAEVWQALWELSRRREEQTLKLEDRVQQHLEQNGKLDPSFEKALPKMRREAAERDQEAVEALAMLAYDAVGLVEQLPVERLRPIAQKLDEWPVFACRHPVARKDIETILGELEVGKNSLLQTMSPKSRWDWHKGGTKWAMFLISEMPHARFLRSFEFWRDEFREPFTMRGLLNAITSDGIVVPGAGSSVFYMDEFCGQFSTHGLLEAITAGGIRVPKARTELESLNTLLNSDALHQRFKGIPLPEVMKRLVRSVSRRTGNKRARLNRLILETVFPKECPKNPPAGTELESLNRMLMGTGLHQQFKRLVLPKVARNIPRRKSELNDNERTRLNRFILEAAYPRECPKHRFLALGNFKTVERTFGRICKINATKWKPYYKRLFDEYFPHAEKHRTLRRLVVTDMRVNSVGWAKGEWQAKIFDRVWRFLLKTLRQSQK